MIGFQARWKEELIVTTPSGSLMLELVGNPLVVYFPPEGLWRDRAPAWAKELWPQLDRELQAWCDPKNVKIVVDASARVY